jgi:AhpD family alkylhydroperoxidase
MWRRWRFGRKEHVLVGGYAAACRRSPNASEKGCDAVEKANHRFMRITIDPTVVAENFSAFKNNSSLEESAQLFAKGLPIAEMIQAFAMNRSVLSAFAGFEAIYPHGGLERGILEKVILCISVRNQCQFCIATHQDFARSLGISVENADQPESPNHSTRERLAIEYALAVHRNSSQVSADLFQRLQDAFADAEIVELTFLTGFINMLNWFNNALEVRYRMEFQGLNVG